MTNPKQPDSSPLSCPFCGAMDAIPASPSLGAPRWRVICDDCGAEGPPRGTYQAFRDDADAEAIAAWNTRDLTAISPSLRAQTIAEVVAWLRWNNSAKGAVGVIDRTMCSVDDGPWDIASALADALESGEV